MNVTINNQCSNIDLTSPVHFIKDTTCHGHFPQQVGSKSEMKVNFKIGMSGDAFGGALLYHLQRNVDTSISTQLLVIWKFRINKLYSHTWLIEHESTLIWSEDMLERLYDVYNSQIDTEFIFGAGKWMLDDKTELQTKCKSLYNDDFEMNITISEEKKLDLSNETTMG
jgi:hypothetical protein